MTFIIIRKLFNTKSAVIGVIISSFFSANLYLETLGLHFVSSTAIFLIFFYFLVTGFRNNSLLNSAFIGISCAFCYLFYSSSYIALPIMFIYYLIQFIKINNFKKNLYNIFISTIGLLIVLSPFLINMYKEKNFYLSGRIKQVSIINGEWSGTTERIKNGESIKKIVIDNFILSFRSLYKNGIGGQGGYNFGHLALFEKSSIFLLLAGTLTCLFLFFFRKKTELIFIAAIISIAFISGMALTIPPPPFHRFSVVFPFLTIIECSFFFVIFEKKILSNETKCIITIVLLVLYCISNQIYFNKLIKDEKENIDVKLSVFIKQNYISRKIYIASFPGYALEKIIYFTIKNKGSKTLISTDYHQNYINKFDPTENYLYVLIFPDIFNNKFQELDPAGKLIKYSKNYSFFVKEN